MNPQLSRIEDEARMHELRELFALLEEKNLHTTSSNEKVILDSIVDNKSL